MHSGIHRAVVLGMAAGLAVGVGIWAKRKVLGGEERERAGRVEAARMEAGRGERERNARAAKAFEAALPVRTMGAEQGEVPLLDAPALEKALRAGWENDPTLGIGEMALLTEADWLRAAQMMLENANGTEEGQLVNRIYRFLRNRSRGVFTPVLRAALDGYLAANRGVLPKSMSELTPYLSVPIDASILDRYRVLNQGPVAALPDSAPLISEVAGAVGQDSDGVMTIAKVGGSIAVTSGAEIAVYHALNQFRAEHSGAYPTLEQLRVALPAVEVAEIERFALRLGAAPGTRYKGATGR